VNRSRRLLPPRGVVNADPGDGAGGVSSAHFSETL
jgi:hypothetical protein